MEEPDFENMSETERAAYFERAEKKLHFDIGVAVMGLVGEAHPAISAHAYPDAIESMTAVLITATGKFDPELRELFCAKMLCVMARLGVELSKHTTRAHCEVIPFRSPDSRNN